MAGIGRQILGEGADHPRKLAFHLIEAVSKAGQFIGRNAARMSGRRGSGRRGSEWNRRFLDR